MANNIKVNTPAAPFSGQIVTFPAPCNCDEVTDGLVINGETYTVCDAMGECVIGKGGAWCAGAQISVVLDCENKKAFIQNAASPNLKAALNAHIDNTNNPHKVTADQVAVTENVVNAFEQTGNWSVNGILAQIGSTLFGGDVLYRWQKAKYTLIEEECPDIYEASTAYNLCSSAEVVVNSDSTITLVDSAGTTVSLDSNIIISEGWYFIPANAVTASIVYRAKSDCVATLKKPANTAYKSITNVLKVTGNADIELVTSTDPDAYTDGYVDAEGYTYTALDPITAFVPRIQTGSYMGTGTCGASNPNSLTFSFAPKMVWITGGGHKNLFFASELTESYAEYGYLNCSTTSMTANAGLGALVDANTLKWYGYSTATQTNTSGVEYTFCAIG